jgi:transglutaminase-like putative cysteine protease
MHRIILPVVAALALSSGALAEEPTAQAAVRSFKFNYGFTLKDVPQDAQSIKVWVPVPQTSAWQNIGAIDTESKIEPQQVSDAEYGNKFLLFDFSDVSPSADGTYTASITYDIMRLARRPIDNGAQSTNISIPAAAQVNILNSDQFRSRWLQPDSMVPLDGKIAAEATATATMDSPTTIETARAIYDHIVDSVKYDKTGPAGTWGRGDAIYACDVRAGNCTDFHSLLIGELRSLGIPARFTIGFSIPTDKPVGEVPGYHCWAEFWDDSLGWLPVDASEASKNPARRDELFGGLDANRVDFSWGRDITLPEAEGGPVNFIIYPYVEVDGKKYDGFDKKFSYEDL